MVKRDVNVNWASLINSHFTKSRIFNKSLSVLVGKTQTFYDLYVLILHTVIGVSNQCSPPAILTSSSFLDYCFSSQPIQQIQHFLCPILRRDERRHIATIFLYPRLHIIRIRSSRTDQNALRNQLFSLR